MIMACAIAGGVWLSLPELAWEGRIVLVTFTLAIFGWVATKINDTYIALVAALVYTLVGMDTPEQLFASLGDSTIWLLVASFIVAAAVNASGLSQRLALRLAGGARSVVGLCYRLTLFLTLTAFVMPATSGRAALMLPIFLTLSGVVGRPRITRALALLFPSVILLSAAASITGAGAHLATAEIIYRMTGERIGFARWLILGLPFALLSSFTATWVITHLFLRRDERLHSLEQAATQLARANPAARGAFTVSERLMVAIVLVMLLLWATEGLHGISSTLVALCGALVATMPSLGPIAFKDALKQVEWNLLLFMAATTQLGAALTRSGAAEWLVERLIGALGEGGGLSLPLVIALVAGISLLAHLLITSRTARSMVLAPIMVVLGLSLGLNPTAIAFLSTIAAGYCLSMPASAKPLALFSQLEPAPFRQRDLTLLGAALLPLHMALLLAFALYIWPIFGLSPLVPHRATAVSVPAWYTTSHARIQASGFAPTAWAHSLEQQSAPLRAEAARRLYALARWIEQQGATPAKAP
jgi:solute carrier family 13 (sodium-dependent dicarboxylate transporter), member 2/3/5